MEKNPQSQDSFAELTRLTQELVAFAEGDISTHGDLTAPEFKQELARKRGELVAKQTELRLASERSRLAMEAAQNAARAAMLPLQKELDRMAEGIWTVGLYLGVGEDIVPLHGGTPAPVGTPITVRQQVLAMDEESIIASEYGGIDAQSIEEFDRWITEDPKHLNQVLPELRGVVAILPTRQQRAYGNPWMDAAMSKENMATWFLVRNGERLYRLLANDFNAGARLIPKSDEFTSYFAKDRWGNPIAPGTPQWKEAEDSAGAKQRHYMRVALILQGLLERTDVFSPVNDNVSFLTTESYELGHIVALSDDEKVLTTMRKPFFEWLTEKNNGLRTGMRVVGSFSGSAFQSVDYSSDYSSHSRLAPRTAEHPPSDTVLYVEQNARKEMVVRYKQHRADQWDDELRCYRAPKKRASVQIMSSDRFIIPIDLVTVSEMQEYIDARTERHNYLEVVPLMKSAIAAKIAEQEEEAPFRRLIVDTLSVHHGVEFYEAEEEALSLVDWWKFTNQHHRALVSDDAEFVAKAMKMIIKEHLARKKAQQGKGTHNATVQQVRSLNPAVMAILKKRSGEVIALVPYVSKYNISPPNTYFTQLKYSNKELSMVKEWSTITPHNLAKMETLWGNTAWNEWSKEYRPSSNDLNDIEIDQILGLLGGDSSLAVETRLDSHYSQGEVRTFTAYQYAGEVKPSDHADGTAELEIEVMRATFKRGKDGLIISTEKSHARNWTKADYTPWLREPFIKNEAMITKALEDLKPIELENSRVRDIQIRRRAIIEGSGGVKQQWRKRAEEEALKSFVAEYGSSELFPRWLTLHPVDKLTVSTGMLEKAANAYIAVAPIATGEQFEFSDYVDDAETKVLLAGITVLDYKP